MSPAPLEIDARVLREALSVIGERLGAGVVVVARGGIILFATPRAARMLGGSTIRAVPREIAALGDRLEAAESSAEMASFALAGTPHPTTVHATRLGGTPRHVLLTLTEEAPRAGLTSTLVAKFGLSDREVELVKLASRGLRNKEIGERMSLSEATVKTYLHGIFRELGVRNRAELVALADRLSAVGVPVERAV